MKEKKYADKGKYAAPRWLVYPELSAYTIGWRMGYGEDYRMNEPPRDGTFFELFPQPQNWSFDTKKNKSGKIPLLGFMWTDYGIPKYSEFGEDKVTVNDFITMQDEKEFRYDHYRNESIEYAILLAKYLSFAGVYNEESVSIEDLMNFEISDENNAIWEEFKYSVCLNASYYKIMQDDDLKEKLLQTGDKTLVYLSDDEWGGKSNLFGFALMELRDEIRRLYKNEDLIDWEYTEYLKNAYPYVTHHGNPLDDPQSSEYMVFSSVLMRASKYVRDINLADSLSDKYEAGQILTEKAFVDASPKIGKMLTTHRYLILSEYMADLSEFEKESNWGLHTAKNNSKFKVLDVFTHEGKTQIVLLQLPDGFKSVFEGTIDLVDEVVKNLRQEFIDTFDMDVVEELSGDDWLNRCSFPIGMSDEGEFY